MNIKKIAACIGTPLLALSCVLFYLSNRNGRPDLFGVGKILFIVGLIIVWAPALMLILFLLFDKIKKLTKGGQSPGDHE